MNPPVQNKPYKYNLINLRNIFESISAFLEQKIIENEKFKEYSPLSDLFCGNKQAKISLEKYLQRLGSLPIFETNTIILAMIYLDRLCEMNSLIVNKENIHRLLLVSLLISIKYNEDVHISNLFFSKIGGIPLHSLNMLEIVFLQNIQFSLQVDECLFTSYFQKIIKFRKHV